MSPQLDDRGYMAQRLREMSLTILAIIIKAARLSPTVGVV